MNYDAVTVLNEHYIMKMMRATGLDRVMPLNGEDDDTYLIRLQAVLVDTLQLPDLLGGYLLPGGKTEADWTLEMAADTSKWIGGLTSAKDKAEVHRMGYMVTLDFFAAGLASLKRSQNALQALRMGPGSDKPSRSAEH